MKIIIFIKNLKNKIIYATHVCLMKSIIIYYILYIKKRKNFVKGNNNNLI